MKMGFDGGIQVEFHGAKVTSDGGLLAYRDLDDALGLFDSVSAVFSDKRTGRNIQHAMPTLLRQSIYSRFAGYEDVNDAQRLSVDPVMRVITGKKDNGKQAASANTIGRFETDILTQQENLTSLSDINSAWVQKAMSKTFHQSGFHRDQYERQGRRRGSFLQWLRNRRAMDKRRQICFELDTARMQAFRLRSSEALVVCSGLQSGQFPSPFGPSRKNKTLVTSQPSCKTDQDRSKGCQAKQIRHVSDGRGYDGQEIIC